MTNPTPEERADAESFREALRHPAPKSRDLGRLAMRLSSFALIGLVVDFLLLAAFELKGAAVAASLATVLLSSVGGVLALVALCQPGARVLRCIGAILMSTVAWLIALFLGFMAMGGAGAPGRAMRVRGKRVLPRVVRERSRRTRRSSDDEPDLTLVPERTRRVLAKLWLEDARGEHASVPAFEHLALDLLAAAAPEYLVAGARRAALEEVEHATICFAIASSYGGMDLRASWGRSAPVWRPAAGSRRALLMRLAVESLIDGCIEEGIAAESARLGARHATEPAIRRALDRIAREEAGHADLACAIVDWAIREEPSLLPALREELEDHGQRLRDSWRGRETESLLPHGRTDAGTAVVLARQAHERAAELLEASSAQQRARWPRSA